LERKVVLVDEAVVIDEVEKLAKRLLGFLAGLETAAQLLYSSSFAGATT